MPLFPNLIRRYGEGDGNVGEIQIIPPYAVPVGLKLRISDFTGTINGAATFWLSTEAAGIAAGHFFSVHVPVSDGTAQIRFETPLEIMGGNSVYCHYDSGGAGSVVTACWHGELFELKG